MRIVFFGTPAFALPSLEAARRGGTLTAVVTQPPRPAGRGMATAPSPVEVRARELSVPVHSPAAVRDPAFLDLLRGQDPDLAVVVAYGRILPPAVLAIPRLGCVNVHASLLPRLRGAAPIQWAIANRLPVTGVTLMQLDEGMDTGPLLMAEETPIGEEETAPLLSRRLSEMGGSMLARALPLLEKGALTPRPQDPALATYAPLVRKEDGRVRWERPAGELAARARGFCPWPGSWTTRGEERLSLTAVRAVPGGAGSAAPGTVVAAGREGIDLSTGEGLLRVLSLRPEGKREMAAAEYLAGHRVAPGEAWGGAG